MSQIFYKHKPIIGLDISKTSAKIMSIGSNRVSVHGYGSIELDPLKLDSSQDGSSYLADKLKEMLTNKIVGRIDSNRVALGVPTGQTFSRTFALPAKEEKNLRNAVNIEAEQYIPVPLESLYLDHQIIKRTKDEITVLMCAAPKKVVDTLLESVKLAGLEVALVEPSINATARLLVKTEEGTLPTVIVDIGSTTTDVAILDAAVRVTGGLSIGGNTFTTDLAKKLNVPMETAHQLKVLNGLKHGPNRARIAEALQPGLNKIVNEIKKVMRYYTDRFPDEKKIEQILIVGGGSNLPGIGEFLTNELVMPARVASPWQMLSFGKEPPDKQLRAHFTPVAGLALIHLEDIYD